MWSSREPRKLHKAPPAGELSSRAWEEEVGKLKDTETGAFALNL